MMRNDSTNDFLIQLAALLVAIILIHALYVAVIWPNAAAIQADQEARQEAGQTTSGETSIYTILRDYEQESCLILGCWAIAMMAMRIRTTRREFDLLDDQVFSVTPGTSILPEDSREYSRPLQALDDEQREGLVARALLTALQRFGSTRNIQDVSTAIREVCDTESDRLDSELSMIRYIIWAIPAIGFIGTVRGIGMALAQADQAVQGDIVGVTVALGTAFNSTLVALIISIFVMFMMHQVQRLQERLVIDTQNFCDVNLVRHLQVR